MGFYSEEKGNLGVRYIFFVIFLRNFLNKSDLVNGFFLLVYLNLSSGCNWEEFGWFLISIK